MKRIPWQECRAEYLRDTNKEEPRPRLTAIDGGRGTIPPMGLGRSFIKGPRVAYPHNQTACEKCAWGSGEHSLECPRRVPVTSESKTGAITPAEPFRRCTGCKQELGAQHLPHCFRQGTVTDQTPAPPPAA